MTKNIQTIFSSDPVAASGRVESIYNILQGYYAFVKPHIHPPKQRNTNIHTLHQRILTQLQP